MVGKSFESDKSYGRKYFKYFPQDACTVFFTDMVPINCYNLIEIIRTVLKKIHFVLGPIWQTIIIGDRMFRFTGHWSRTCKYLNTEHKQNLFKDSAASKLHRLAYTHIHTKCTVYRQTGSTQLTWHRPAASAIIHMPYSFTKIFFQRTWNQSFQVNWTIWKTLCFVGTAISWHLENMKISSHTDNENIALLVLLTYAIRLFLWSNSKNYIS